MLVPSVCDGCEHEKKKKKPPGKLQALFKREGSLREIPGRNHSHRESHVFQRERARTEPLNLRGLGRWWGETVPQETTSAVQFGFPS